MNKNGFVHLDIKNDNIIVHGKMLKYIDFGLCGNTVDALDRISGILDAPTYNYPPEFYCWMYMRHEPNMKANMRPHVTLPNVLGTWYTSLPEIVKTFNPVFSDVDLTQIESYYFTREFQLLSAKDQLKKMFMDISMWQLGMTIVVAIDHAREHIHTTELPPAATLKGSTNSWSLLVTWYALMSGTVQTSLSVVTGMSNLRNRRLRHHDLLLCARMVCI